MSSDRLGEQEKTIYQELRSMLKARQEQKQLEAEQQKKPSVDPDEDTDDTQNLVYSIPVDHEGTAVFVKGWAKANSEYPPLVIVHDLGENIALYRTAARRLGEEGFSVFGFDLRGHGRSGRLLGHIPHFDSLVNDLLQVVAWIRFKSNRRVPLIVGQGLGALITVYFQKAYPQMVDGSVLVAPVLDHKLRLTLVHRLLVRGMAEVLPRSRLPRSLVPRFVTRAPAVEGMVEKTYHGITANFAKELINAVMRVGDHFKQFETPSLIIAPETEQGYDFENLFQMIAQHPHAAQFHPMPLAGIGLQPLTADEAQLETVMKVMLPWLKTHFAKENAQKAESLPKGL
ncbi:MAG: alpha/beta fold hydrolase [Oligoflexus sp.]